MFTKKEGVAETNYSIKPIGVIRSDLTERRSAPHQGFEGAPEAWVEVEPAAAEGLEGISAGAEIILVTWLTRPGGTG